MFAPMRRGAAALGLPVLFRQDAVARVAAAFVDIACCVAAGAANS